jgi:hypothetical protein
MINNELQCVDTGLETAGQPHETATGERHRFAVQENLALLAKSSESTDKKRALGIVAF